MKRLFAVVFVLLMVSISSNALAGTSTFSCTFDTYSSPEGIEDAKDFAFTILVDTITKKAVFVGNNGLTDVLYFKGLYGITFLEKLFSGTVQSTSISLETGQAVHSRHSLIGTLLVPSQYYGKCSVPSASE